MIVMDKVTQQNTALVKQAAAAAQSLKNHAIDMKHAVSVFVVADHVEKPAQLVVDEGGAARILD
ncbi:methyl-accepting chemotaxis sensory transducer [Burkholderia pseudomallei 576]|nr:methyl-accepting chemotaxis sensory transducer [Burkholderia pseudomallei 576]